MKQVGAVGMREALRLGVTSHSHASDLKDGGIESPTAAIADAVVTGALEALAAQRYLSEKGASPAPSVGQLTLLACPAFFADTTAAGIGRSRQIWRAAFRADVHHSRSSIMIPARPSCSARPASTSPP